MNTHPALTKLLEKAAAATPGPWRSDPQHRGDIQTDDGLLEIACTNPRVLIGGKKPDEWLENYHFIAAANPETIRKLVEVIGLQQEIIEICGPMIHPKYAEINSILDTLVEQ